MTDNIYNTCLHTVTTQGELNNQENTRAVLHEHFPRITTTPSSRDMDLEMQLKAKIYGVVSIAYEKASDLVGHNIPKHRQDYSKTTIDDAVD